MPKLETPLAKMKTEWADPIRYSLPTPEGNIDMNELIGSKISFHYTGKIKCFCGDIKTKVYRNNFCYDCFWTKPEAGESIFRPELSKAHLGIEDRDLAWEVMHHVQPHYVYLAISSGLKVGVTRAVNIPFRWIDQGAIKAIKLARTPNRYNAGQIEVALKEFIDDKTNWQRMLKNQIEDRDLVSEKARLGKELNEELQGFLIDDNEITEIHYPVDQYPVKVKSLNLSKTPTYSGNLKGIRGQYLIFGDGMVFNVRNSEGMIVEMEY
jgi:hypothetical protein